ncbi:MAG: hypothetical protein LBK73_09485 [Treponema sp.]|jgi:DNA replicative helicase MCM subunit Mcm2 (Cdc46/Mcm family)|nr:hypothetical protein [Treponema sp.]
MGKIKTALEIALERTESIKSDKAAIEQFEAKQTGKRLANSFLENPEKSAKALEDALKNAPKEQRTSLKEGMFETLLSRITLPVAKEDEAHLHDVGKGLQAIIKNSHFHGLYRQMLDILSRYLEENVQYEDAVKRQYEPRLRKKEAELSKRYGQPVKLDPFQDPEFVSFYKQNMEALRANYQAVVDEARQEAVEAFENAPV